MKKFPAWLAAPALAATLIVAGCGGGHHSAAPVIKPPLNTAKAAVVKAKVVNQHVCDPRDYTLGCPLPTAPVSAIVRGVDPTLQGIDFAWSCPSPAGHGFGASYLSYDFSKNWTLRCVSYYHANHAATVAVWETSATRATQGYSAGQSDAAVARTQAASLGNTTRPIFFAIDQDVAGTQVASYFDGVKSVLGKSRTGAYGGVRPISYLFDTGRIGYGWQTYAWSSGQWDSRAKLEQYLNGSSVDYDRAVAVDYGQWPYTLPVVAFNYHYLRFPVGPFYSSRYGQLDERAIVKLYDKLRPGWVLNHNRLLYLRYEMVFLWQRISRLNQTRVPAVTAINWGNWRAHQLWLRGLEDKQIG